MLKRQPKKSEQTNKQKSWKYFIDVFLLVYTLIIIFLHSNSFCHILGFLTDLCTKTQSRRNEVSLFPYHSKTFAVLKNLKPVSNLFQIVCYSCFSPLCPDHGGSLMQPKTSSSRLAEEPGKQCTRAQPIDYKLKEKYALENIQFSYLPFKSNHKHLHFTAL